MSTSADGNILTLKCKNFDNVLGTGLKEAVEIGNHGTKKLYLTFMVYGNEMQKKLEYSFFMGGKDD